MKNYNGKLAAEQLSRWKWRLTRDLSYDDALEAGLITAPAGFNTDFATLRPLRTLWVIWLLALVICASVGYVYSDHLWVNLLLGGLWLFLYAMLAGYGNAASTIHDLLYTQKKLPRAVCDRVFYRALRDEGVTRWRAILFYVGVRAGGWFFYNRHN